MPRWYRIPIARSEEECRRQDAWFVSFLPGSTSGNPRQVAHGQSRQVSGLSLVLAVVEVDADDRISTEPLRLELQLFERVIVVAHLLVDVEDAEYFGGAGQGARLQEEDARPPARLCALEHRRHHN